MMSQIVSKRLQEPLHSAELKKLTGCFIQVFPLNTLTVSRVPDYP